MASEDSPIQEKKRRSGGTQVRCHETTYSSESIDVDTDGMAIRLQLLVHSDGVDYSRGYAELSDLSELLPAKDMEELCQAIKDRDVFSGPYTILNGGHVVDAYEFQRMTHKGALLAVPQDPIIKVSLLERKSIFSLSRFDMTVAELKQVLQQQVCVECGPLLIFDQHGNSLHDAKQLGSCGCFTRYSSVICRPQLHEYSNYVQPNERLLSALNVAKELQKEWCVIGDFGDLPSKICEDLATLITDRLQSSNLCAPQPEALKSSSYDRFVADFPKKEAPTVQVSQALAQARVAYLNADKGNSKCPAFAISMADKIIRMLSGKNVELADGVAACLQDIISPIALLSAKDPMVHDHADRKRKINQAEMSLNRYRDVRAGKMYTKTEEYQQKLDAVSTLGAEMSQIMTHFSEFYSEWVKAKCWSELSMLDCVQDENLTPATKRAAALVESAEATVKAESELLEALHKLEWDAVHHNTLIQNQVLWCKNVVMTAQERTDEDIKDLDTRIRQLMTERAAKELLRNSLKQRVERLDAQAASEAGLFQRFKAQFEEKKSTICERLEHAKLGSEVANEFKVSLGTLQKMVEDEIQALRETAQGLLIDVAADCADAYRVAHSVNFIIQHYEKGTLRSHEMDKDCQDNKYQRAMVDMRRDRAQEALKELEKIKLDIEGSNKKILECEEAIASLDLRVAEPWAWVCQHQVGGPGPALETTRVVVRTSKDNTETWDGEDRALERPDEWNRAMQAEAEAFKTQLMLSCGD